MEIEVISKPREEYKTVDYKMAGLPCAPAISIDGEVIIEGKDISEAELEEALRKKSS